MDFNRCVKKEIVKISADQYAPKACPSCGSSEITIRKAIKGQYPSLEILIKNFL